MLNATDSSRISGKKLFTVTELWLRSFKKSLASRDFQGAAKQVNNNSLRIGIFGELQFHCLAFAIIRLLFSTSTVLLSFFHVKTTMEEFPGSLEVKEPAVAQVAAVGFNPWPENYHILWAWPKKKSYHGNGTRRMEIGQITTQQSSIFLPRFSQSSWKSAFGLLQNFFLSF